MGGKARRRHTETGPTRPPLLDFLDSPAGDSAARARPLRIAVEWGKQFTGEATFDLTDFDRVLAHLRQGCRID